MRPLPIVLGVVTSTVAVASPTHPADAQPPASHPLVTAFAYTGVEGEGGAATNLALDRVRAAGATAFHLTVQWRSVAPATRVAGFNEADPASSAYRWASVDFDIRAIVRHRLEPIVAIIDAPDWAYLPGTTLPSAGDFAEFGRAIATRYSGQFRGLPRVRYWQAWLEPNLTPLLAPQLQDGKPVAPIHYRQMVNAFAAQVHAVNSDNVVVAGGLAPFRDITGDVTRQDSDWGPLSFMRAMLCISPAGKSTCNTKVHFDVWAHHPYTSGGPEHHAVLANDVSLGDLPKLRTVLAAAERVGHVVSNGPVALWATEFSWDSRPPDPSAVPLQLLERWVPEALYQMWRNGMSTVVWLSLRDGDATSAFQSGLYFRGKTIQDDRPKPYLEGFRFPVVAYRKSGGIFVWGRTPGGQRGKVVVELSRGSRWRSLAMLQADQYGIFEETFDEQTTASDSVRARLASNGETSLPFSLRSVPDQFFSPFGGNPLEPPPKPGKLHK